MYALQVDVADMGRAVARLIEQPHHEVKHPEYGTLMRMLDAEVPFTIELADEGSMA